MYKSTGLTHMYLLSTIEIIRLNTYSVVFHTINEIMDKWTKNGFI